jgi:hypothetical protein
MSNSPEFNSADSERAGSAHRAAELIKAIALGVMYTLEPLWNRNADPLAGPSDKWKAQHDQATVLASVPSPRASEGSLSHEVMASGE